MSSPWPSILIVILYIKFSTDWGPRWMKNRPPFQIDRIVQVYDVIQVLFNLFMFYKANIPVTYQTKSNRPTFVTHKNLIQGFDSGLVNSLQLEMSTGRLLHGSSGCGGMKFNIFEYTKWKWIFWSVSTDSEIVSSLLSSENYRSSRHGFFHTSQETKPSDIFAHLSSCKYGSCHLVWNEIFRGRSWHVSG